MTLKIPPRVESGRAAIETRLAARLGGYEAVTARELAQVISTEGAEEALRLIELELATRPAGSTPRF